MEKVVVRSRSIQVSWNWLGMKSIGSAYPIFTGWLNSESIPCPGIMHPANPGNHFKRNCLQAANRPAIPLLLGEKHLIPRGPVMFSLKMKSIDDGTHLVQASGRITQNTVSQNKNAFVDVLGENAFSSKVVLGFEGVEHVDSSGVGWLLTSNRQFGEKGGKLVLHSLSPSVKNVFGMLNLNHVLTLATSEDEAKHSLDAKDPGQ